MSDSETSLLVLSTLLLDLTISVATKLSSTIQNISDRYWHYPVSGRSINHTKPIHHKLTYHHVDLEQKGKGRLRRSQEELWSWKQFSEWISPILRSGTNSRNESIQCKESHSSKVQDLPHRWESSSWLLGWWVQSCDGTTAPKLEGEVDPRRHSRAESWLVKSLFVTSKIHWMGKKLDGWRGC